MGNIKSEWPRLFTIRALMDESDSKLLYLNYEQINTLKLYPGMVLSLGIGMVEEVVKITTQTFDSSPNILYLSRSLLEEYYYYDGEPISLVVINNDGLFLGPSIGQTISNSAWRNIMKSKSLKERAQLAIEKGVLLFYFNLNKVNWEKNLVKAYKLIPNNRWVKVVIPVPRVIHDRGSYPGPFTVESFANKGGVRNIQWINTTRTLGKLETYQALKNSLATAEYVPDTTILTLSDLNIFLKKFRYCYVKANFGRGGVQVFRVEREDELYTCKTGGSEVISQHFYELYGLFSFLQSRLGPNAILQEGIHLAKIDRGPFDMRVLAQKNECNKWVLSAVNLRIGAPGAIVTNFSAGARDIFISPSEIQIHPQITWEKIKKISFHTVKALEDHFGGLGEIGLDVALDIYGKLWIIEANSRPSSIAYREASKDDLMLIYGLPLDYASYLIRHTIVKQSTVDKKS